MFLLHCCKILNLVRRLDGRISPEERECSNEETLVQQSDPVSYKLMICHMFLARMRGHHDKCGGQSLNNTMAWLHINWKV